MTMSDSDSQSYREKNSTNTENDQTEPIASEEEDDCENYFLQPAGDGLNIAEKIAEANKKLLEESEEEEDGGNRFKKVQFSEDLVNFEPSYYSDEEYNESARNSTLSEEDSELKLIPEEFSKEMEEKEEEEISAKTSFLNCKSSSKESLNDEIDEVIEEIDEEFEISHKNSEMLKENNEGDNKLLLVILPREQNSSCESTICEDESEDAILKLQNEMELEKVNKSKITRPKSASSLKHKKSCEVSKISPVLDYSSNIERTSWQVSQNLHSKPINKVSSNQKKNKDETKNFSEKSEKVVKKVNIGNLGENNFRKLEGIKRCCDNRPKSSYFYKNSACNVNRPKTAPVQRTCCVLKSDLPQYNGLRSEYGLSAQQLQERKQKTMQIKHERKQNQLKERQEELRKLHLNEESFKKWLLNKNKKCVSKSSAKITDTLTRSDAFIQAHASYATNRNVPYSIDYNLTKKLSSRTKELVGKKSNKSLVVEKFIKKVPLHGKKSFNIYLGVKQ